MTPIEAAALLAIETAGSRCSAAVVQAGAVLAHQSIPLRHGHAEALLPMIDRVTMQAGLRPTALGHIAAATGPGGFTGIRAGLAAAGGIALALGVRPTGISSFAAVAALVEPCETALLVALDSRRDDLYVQLFAAASEPLARPAAVLPDQLPEYVGKLAGSLIVAGDAAESAATALADVCDCTIVANSAPDAFGVAVAAQRQRLAGGIGAPLRPLYLRPPDVTIAAPARPAANAG